MRPVVCPSCGADDLDLRTFRSCMVLSPVLAFFTLRCPYCSTTVSTVAPIPASLQDEVAYAAVAIGAGMGQGSQEEQC